MKKETKRSLARVTEEAILDAVGCIAGAVGEYLIAPFFVAVIKYDFLWRNPEASKDATNLRVKQEVELFLAKLRHKGYVNICDVEPSRKYYFPRSFGVYLEDLLDRMNVNGATSEERKIMADMCHYYGSIYNSTISVNNLRWIHKMENKYGVEERDYENE